MTDWLDNSENGLYSVIFTVSNKLSVDLRFSRFECAVKMRFSFDDDQKYHPTAAYKGPETLPHGKKTAFTFADVDILFGAEATVDFVADVDGQRRKYTWSGYCPSSVNLFDANAASGPGMAEEVPCGAPLLLNVEIDETTTGWTECCERHSDTFRPVRDCVLAAPW